MPNNLILQKIGLISPHYLSNLTSSVADPRFPIGGRGPRKGGVDSRGGYVSKILYVEKKESGP